MDICRKSINLSEGDASKYIVLNQSKKSIDASTLLNSDISQYVQIESDAPENESVITHDLSKSYKDRRSLKKFLNENLYTDIYCYFREFETADQLFI